jgi:hypothetical protein
MAIVAKLDAKIMSKDIRVDDRSKCWADPAYAHDRRTHKI